MKNPQAYFNAQNLTQGQKLAAQRYVDSTTQPGSLYSISQNMNWALANGLPLSTQQAQCYNGMMNAMHDLGHDMQLTRYDHIDFIDTMLSGAGIQGNAQNMTVQQLDAALKGYQYSENRLLSASMTDFANAPRSSTNVFKTRMVQIVYDAPAHTQVVMPGTGSGGNLDEVVMKNSGQLSYKVTGVSLSGNSARMKGTQTLNQQQIRVHVQIQ